MTIEQTRARALAKRSLAGDTVALPLVKDLAVNGTGSEIPIRVYKPDETPRLPVFIYLHGGRFISGDLETHDAICSSPSHTTFKTGYGPGSDDMRRGYREYAPAGTDMKAPLLSPLYANNLEGLPPAFILTAEYDSLRDEAETYAKRLQASGVATVLKRYEGAIHGAIQMAGKWEIGKRIIIDISNYLKEMLSPQRN
jgi:acetyl esterase/lipase